MLSARPPPTAGRKTSGRDAAGVFWGQDRLPSMLLDRAFYLPPVLMLKILISSSVPTQREQRRGNTAGLIFTVN